MGLKYEEEAKAVLAAMCVAASRIEQLHIIQKALLAADEASFNEGVRHEQNKERLAGEVNWDRGML